MIRHRMPEQSCRSRRQSPCAAERRGEISSIRWRIQSNRAGRQPRGDRADQARHAISGVRVNNPYRTPPAVPRGRRTCSRRAARIRLRWRRSISANSRQRRLEAQFLGIGRVNAADQRLDQPLVGFAAKSPRANEARLSSSSGRAARDEVFRRRAAAFQSTLKIGVVSIGAAAAAP